MTLIAEPAGVAPECQALVVVPFGSRAAAEAWAAQFATSIAPVVTEGEEKVWHDPDTGDERHELIFSGGWRAKFAGSGEVVIARGGRKPS